MEANLLPVSFTESAVINTPLESVWPRLKLRYFAKFYSAISKSEVVGSARGDKDIVRWYFEDGTVLDNLELEYSDDEHYSSFMIVKCEPWGLPYKGAGSTIRAYPVTSGSANGSTFVQWSGHYPADASDVVIEDAKLKRREGLADLAKAVEQGQVSG